MYRSDRIQHATRQVRAALDNLIEEAILEYVEPVLQAQREWRDDHGFPQHQRGNGGHWGQGRGGRRGRGRLGGRSERRDGRGGGQQRWRWRSWCVFDNEETIEMRGIRVVAPHLQRGQPLFMWSSRWR